MKMKKAKTVKNLGSHSNVSSPMGNRKMVFYSPLCIDAREAPWRPRACVSDMGKGFTEKIDAEAAVT